ncbi:MAG: hypothetical protein ACK5L5_12055 [Bacteroidales bacterium]
MKNSRLQYSHRYSIGSVTDINRATRAGDYVSYSFIVDEKMYKGSSATPISDRETIWIDRRFLVKYNPNNPRNSKLQTAYPVPDCIQESPTDGWANLAEYKLMKIDCESDSLSGLDKIRQMENEGFKATPLPDSIVDQIINEELDRN